MSVNQIARATGLDQSALNRFLNRTRDNIRLEVAQKLMDWLGLTVVAK